MLSTLASGEPRVGKAGPDALKALTVVPVGHGVYRYSVSPRSGWTVADLGRILSAIVRSAQDAPDASTGGGARRVPEDL